ncbi:MAG: transcription initiation factor IIB [Crenarchaeota archaeon]|nr:transcription initiation factor IIB [Thermoproteota archaeon]
MSHSEREEKYGSCPPEYIVFDEERGEYICTLTGEVVEEAAIDLGPEWRAYTPEEKARRSRVGAPLSHVLPDYGVLTTMGTYRDATGRKLEARARLEAERLRRLQAKLRTTTSLERNIEQAAREITRLVEALSLPRSIIDDAMLIYRQAAEKGLVRGRSLESVAAAAVYAACRLRSIPKTLDEISDLVKGGRKEVARCYRLLIRELRIRMPLADPTRYVSKIVSALSLSSRVEKRAIEILLQARRLGLTAGKDPAGLAAAAVYIAALELNERRTQKEIAQAAGVTEVTVRNRYKELVQKLRITLPAQ